MFEDLKNKQTELHKEALRIIILRLWNQNIKPPSKSLLNKLVDTFNDANYEFQDIAEFIDELNNQIYSNSLP